MEARFGYNFSQVRVHTDARAAESARQLNAKAYTLRQHVAFAANEYQPGTLAGRQLLAHELAHTIQQAHSSLAVQRACGGLDKNFRQRIVGPDRQRDPCRYLNATDCCDELDGCDRKGAATSALDDARVRLNKAIPRLEKVVIGRELRRTYRQLFGRRKFKKDVVGKLREARDWLKDTRLASKGGAKGGGKSPRDSRRRKGKPARAAD